jgi:hypothetical protein
MAETRQATEILPAERSKIHDLRWATKVMAAAAIPIVTEFFTGAPSSDPCVDRFSAGTLTDSGCKFVIVQLGVQLIPSAGTSIPDMEKIVNFCALRISTNQREFMTIPVYMLAAGGGLDIAQGNISITAAAAPGLLGSAGVTNGVKDRRAMFRLSQSMDIQAQQSFKCELLGPAAGSSFGTQTLATAVTVRVVLDGELWRIAG